MNLNGYKNNILKGRAIWDGVKRQHAIDSKTVILVLSGENYCMDEKAIEMLPEFVKRKRAERAEILIAEPSHHLKEDVGKQKFSFPVQVSIEMEEDLRCLYDYYCFAFNLDNIAFTFLSQCHYNLLGRILSETDITETEAVCLGVYWLREIPEYIRHV